MIADPTSSEPAFLDSSVVVRYLTGEPREMAVVAGQIIERHADLRLSELVLVESAFVLGRVYGVARDPVVDALQALVLRKNIRLEHLSKALTVDALELCRGSRRVSFADALIWAEARASGIETIFTFDRRFPSEGIEIRDR